MYMSILNTDINTNTFIFRDVDDTILFAYKKIKILFNLLILNTVDTYIFI